MYSEVFSIYTITEFYSTPESQICRHCKAYVKGFNHHCPAFGNCIGQKNRVLFIILLVGFVFTEASYVACSSQFATKFQIMDNIGGLTSSSRNLAICTMLFSLLQVLWQVYIVSSPIQVLPYLNIELLSNRNMLVNVYRGCSCCFNIKTDEWSWSPLIFEFPNLLELLKEAF
ncbi:probable palmitoyltransferase ZDHHC12 [Camellia sinensis]|uniref:probable palmitoyltransferase ZDHHC12 n=1 Tax=Camellia sinensis TaxID=4442 RepID=UPI0010356E91|nr:probable palmitoyltransferase ZDHHC12 [Camellia sinensis]